MTTTLYKGDMWFESRIGDYPVVTEVPDVMGDSDRGPQPPQLFVASPGSCIGAFIAQYWELNCIVDRASAVRSWRFLFTGIVFTEPTATCGAKTD